MIWAMIGLDIKTPLIFMPCNADSRNNGYIARSYLITLEEGLLPVYKPGRLFQQDNACIHIAYIMQDWFEMHRIWVIKQLAYSPDLNPIEYVQKVLKQQLYQLYPSLDELRNNKADIVVLRARIEEAWACINQALIYNLIASIPYRLEACQAACGWYTKY